MKTRQEIENRMQNIEFRVWNSKDEEYYGTEVSLKLLYSLSVGGNIEPYWEVFEQYSGLKDRNGVKIYNGDIVRVYSDSKVIGPASEVPVVYQNGCFYTPFAGSKYRLGGWQCPLEVVGNVHNKPNMQVAKEKQ